MNTYKKDGKWYSETEFLGTIWTEEIEDADEIIALEYSERMMDEAIELGII